MFTGIITAVGRIEETASSAGGVKLRIDAAALDLSDVALGDSIAVSGVCLTVVALHERAFDVDVSQETLACAAGFERGAAVNLEKALRRSDRLGGHLVSGHVDGRGVVERIEPVGDSRLLQIAIPSELARYVARKGSIAVDGVSLTVNEVQSDRFSVNLIPHTLAHTNFAGLRPGTQVNVEIDLLARYVERTAQFGQADDKSPEGERSMTWEFITKAVRSANAVSWEWEWRHKGGDARTNASARTFSSFEECIADARLHGFTGDADPGEAGTVFQRPEARFNWY
jgi:riboflavin synthase